MAHLLGKNALHIVHSILQFFFTLFCKTDITEDHEMDLPKVQSKVIPSISHKIN